MKNRQVDKKLTFQARIDRGWWKILLQLKAETGKGFKELIEDALVNTYIIGKDGKPEINLTESKLGRVNDISRLTRN